MNAEPARGHQAPTALIVGLLILGATLAACGSDDGGSGVTSAAEVDSCALLTTEEVATLLPDGGERDPFPPKTENGLTVAGCYWREPDGPDNLALTVVTASEDRIKELYEQSTDGGVPVDDLGDEAAVGSRHSGQSDINVIVEPALYFVLNIHNEGAEAQQEELVDLAKAAVGRL